MFIINICLLLELLLIFWVRLLRSLLSGIYTIDNLDFVLRDAYMSGYSREAYDLERLLHYSFFTEAGLTIHDRGITALVRFMAAKSELFRSIYFHRTVKAIDLTLADLFQESKGYLFDGNPVENLAAYQGFTESSVLVDVSRWSKSNDLTQRELGKKWQRLLERQYTWHMVCERSMVFSEADRETSNIFSDQSLVETKLRGALPAELRELPLRVDIARHIHRPHTKGPAGGQNFLYDSASDTVRPLTTNELFRQTPVSHRICRVYAESLEHRKPLAAALDSLLGGSSQDDLTNM